MPVARRRGFTLVEVLIVVVIMAILAAVVIPQFSTSTDDSKAASARSILNTLRTQIQIYRAQHAGRLPSLSLIELTSSTDDNGNIGVGSAYRYGPYFPAVPINPYTQSAVVAAPASVPPTATIPGAGWLYDATTGNIWINDDTTPFALQ
jgi:prepilin-type N-terminal cleavage/methylation domain-containing protein